MKHVDSDETLTSESLTANDKHDNKDILSDIKPLESATLDTKHFLETDEILYPAQIVDAIKVMNFEPEKSAGTDLALIATLIVDEILSILINNHKKQTDSAISIEDISRSETGLADIIENAHSSAQTSLDAFDMTPNPAELIIGHLMLPENTLEVLHPEQLDAPPVLVQEESLGPFCPIGKTLLTSLISNQLLLQLTHPLFNSPTWPQSLISVRMVNSQISRQLPMLKSSSPVDQELAKRHCS